MGNNNSIKEILFLDLETIQEPMNHMAPNGGPGGDVYPEGLDTL